MTFEMLAPPGPAYRRPTLLLLLAVALLGIAHVAFLPPFEGYDENAHWSFIQQIGDELKLPTYVTAKISTDVEDYAGPRSFDRGTPEHPPGAAFRSFFAGPHADLSQRIERLYRPGDHGNWEPRQQPPLYYVVLAPFYRIAQDWSWPDHFLLLRLVSWGFAFAGFTIGCRASQRCLAGWGAPPVLLLVVPSWPILFPEFFPEMARLGNDSLCLFFAGIAWWLVVRLLEQPRLAEAALLGLVLGLGLWTKAFFLPLSLGLGLLFAYAALRRRDPGHLRDIALALVLAAVIGGYWYLGNFEAHGTVFGLTEFDSAKYYGGVWHGLMQLPPLVLARELARGMAMLAATFAWGGTWTLAHPPAYLMTPVVLLALIPACLWLRYFFRWPLAGMAPLLLAGPILAGLVSHELLSIATQGYIADTPGWYLHVVAGPLSLVLALGWRWPRLLAILAGYAVLFHALTWAAQLSLFSGCAYKPGQGQSLALDPGSCLIEPAHLAELGAPALGFAALALAVAAAAAALYLARRRPAQASERPEPA